MIVIIAMIMIIIAFVRICVNNMKYCNTSNDNDIDHFSYCYYNVLIIMSCSLSGGGGLCVWLAVGPVMFTDDVVLF